MSDRVRIERLTPPRDVRAQLIEDARHGFTAYRKYLPSKYFYDERGSLLFERITHLPEYYLTTAETEILARDARSLMAELGPSELVELGSGSSRKTRMLLEAMHATGGRRYVPIDISASALASAAESLAGDYPWLEIEGFVGDFATDLPLVRRKGSRLIAFLGSTIGNYVPTLRLSLLRTIAEAMVPGDALLLGVDLVKDEPTMTAAYDDSEGVSAAFNRNILAVANRELEANFSLDEFDHVTRWDPMFSCMAQSLRARRDLIVDVKALDLAVAFFEGEELHTEVSCKFTRAGVEADFAATGLQLDEWLTDSAERFALALGSLH